MSKSNAVYDTLVDRGPTTSDALPYDTINFENKHRGVTKFNPRASGGGVGDTASGSGQNTPVYYVDGIHEPQEAIRAWLDANELAAKNLSNRSLHHRISSYGDEWRAASRDILGPFESNGGGDHDTGGTCPLCGAEYATYLPDHLPNCPGP